MDTIYAFPLTYLKRLFFTLAILPALPFLSTAQIGGNNAYEFLTLTSSARIAAMGGNFLPIQDDDVSLAAVNPSLITPDLHNHLGFNVVDFYHDINYGFAAYSRTFEKLGSFVASMQYTDYGSFDLTDETGAKLGKFYGGETALDIGWGRMLDSSFSIGSAFKAIYSSLESYTSYGIAVDVAGTYHNSRHRFTASLLVRNAGIQLKAYQAGNGNDLPLEVALGLSQKLKYLPFRYSILLNHLEKWDLTYDDPFVNETDPITGELVKENKFEDFTDNLMRHIIVGGEMNITKNLYIRAGYNYGRRQELKVDTRVSTVGFSWGLGIRVSKFRFDYARSTYHLAGSPNYISVTTNLSDFVSKK